MLSIQHHRFDEADAIRTGSSLANHSRASAAGIGTDTVDQHGNTIHPKRLSGIRPWIIS